MIHYAVLINETWALHTSSAANEAPVGHAADDDQVLARDPRGAPHQQRAAQTTARLGVAADADRATRQALISAVVQDHLWLADRIARQYQRRGEEADDLVQVARIGLMEACERFDPQAGEFANFASVTIRGLIKRHFRDHTWSIRPPRHTQELVLKVSKCWPELAQRLSNEPSDRQLAARLAVSYGNVREALLARQGYAHVSTDTLLHDPASVDRGFAQTEARIIVESVLPQLTDAERRLLRMRFWEDRRQIDIAAELGVSQMQVSRMLAQLVRTLRVLVGALDDVDPHAA